MTDYLDYQGMNSGHLEAGPSSFVRPLNLADRKSGQTSHTSRTSNTSCLTYATNGSAPAPDETQQSPAEPIMGMPTPVMPPKGLHLPGEEQYDDEDDDVPEYMMVDADLSMIPQFGAQNQPLDVQEPPLKVHHNKPVPVKVQGGRKGFVGGFVSGLRRLPRMLRNQRGKIVQRQPSHDTVLELPGFGEDSPGYDPFRAHPPSIPHHPLPTSHHVPSVPASHPVTSMHYSHYTHDERSESPTSRDPEDFDDEELDHNHSESDEEGDQHSVHRQSTVPPSTHQSGRYSTHLSTHHSNHPSTQRSNQNSSHQSNHHSDRPSPHRSATHSRPQTALDGDTTLIHQTQNGEPEAVVVHPLPTSDYKSMVPESSSSSSNSSHATNVNRIQKFVTDVYNLPWVATNVTVDFIPERDGRRYRGMDPDMKKIPKPLQSWYPPIHKDLDLLAEESQPQSAPVMAHRRQDGHRRALTESSVSPTSAGVTQSVTPSTTYSPRRYSVNSEPVPRHPRHTRDFRHTHRHRRRHRDHSRPHSPPIYPVLASPQPLYLYPGPASPPVIPIPQPAFGSSASSPRSRRGITSPAVPVYMIPIPPPVYQPMSGFPYATPQQTQSQPATNPPTSG
ncbi:hypothetical protein BDM02DRAFT_3120114 [Thelephora ganbajun]|uniref:Uncharacterized protein n=1 Tax=Thelephora ganbajun TaxID=370292 RepID=A0ACB6Z7B5_THEGA|nr:hypothetical protein BDM02DRAFT_3120114 [Thelephora ganbajun]